MRYTNKIHKPLIDYKIYTFNGKAKLMMINHDRGISTKADYFDSNFKRLNFTWGYPNSDYQVEKPINYDKMIAFAERLAKNTVELRVDFYECNGKLFFGELTFFDGSGFTKLNPPQWDDVLGSWLEI